MEKDDPKYTVAVNGLYVEIYDAKPEENFWGNHRIYIYDGLSDMSDRERDSILNYLYEEGFIDDRRTNCQIIRGEDFL